MRVNACMPSSKTAWRHFHPLKAGKPNMIFNRRSKSVTVVHTVLYILCADGGCPDVEVSGYVIILYFLLLCTLSLYLAARHQKGYSFGIPAGAITYSQQCLCEQWEDRACLCVRSHAHVHKCSFLSSCSLSLPVSL